jgi:hypothetical protein
MTEVRVKDVVGKRQYALNNNRAASINRCVREPRVIE